MKSIIKRINLYTIIACVLAIIGLFISILLLDNLPGQDEIAECRAIIACVLLVPILVCYYANKKIERVHRNKMLFRTAIITLIFGNVVSGILMLRISNFH